MFALALRRSDGSLIMMICHHVKTHEPLDVIRAF